MNAKWIEKIAAELHLSPWQIEAVISLFEEGATVTFIARYRKEKTGSLDEVAIIKIRERQKQIEELEKRRQSILASLQERNLITQELSEKIGAAQTMAELEDIYLPFKPKRRTRATIAREKGLEPLANHLLIQLPETNPEKEAQKFLSPERGVESIEEALSGARDIIAELASEDLEVRQKMRELFLREGILFSKPVKGKENEGIKFKDYFDWKEPIGKAPGHRILAIFRGENEGFLKFSIEPPFEKAVDILKNRFVKGNSSSSEQVESALIDGYKRLLAPSMENEIRAWAKEKADLEAIEVFSGNLRELLMAPPLGQKNILAVDPGIRTGCKAVCLDRQGKLLYNFVFFINVSERENLEAEKMILEAVSRFQIEAVAIGNGTGSREAEAFLRKLTFPQPVVIVVVNESGASVYSASDIAREEFPDQDVTVRGAVSIGRRLMDPLAELVKIDPKSIGVGQYQHDVDQGKLKTSLDDVVMSCVNSVGVELNTASVRLLTYVSGLGPSLARNIVSFRNENGPFPSRDSLRKVPRLGPKAFEQAAGFLRVRGSENPLDSSAVHPESYHIVDRMAKDLGCTVSDLMTKEELRKRIEPERYVSENVGMPTIRDILKELAKPGRDPREKFEEFRFADGVEKLEDVKPGMELPGIVTNVTKFGAFVDIGVHQDGLVHISEMADRFVKDPNEIVKVNQKVSVRVIDVDAARKRISLSLRKKPKPTR